MVSNFRNKKLAPTCGVVNVYRMGFKAELIGSTNTANHTVRSPGEEKDFSKIDLSPMTIMGIQQTQSVMMRQKTRPARALSLFAEVDLDLAWISLAVPWRATRLLDR